MMENNINLLPKQKKEKVERISFFIFFKNILSWFLISFSISAVILLWGWMVLIDEFQYLSESTLTVNKEYTKYNQDVKDVNKMIKSFSKVYNGYVQITPKIIDISKNLPNDIKLTSLKLNKEDKMLEIGGTAETREALLNYQQKLKELNWVGDINIPTKQLLKQENINFLFQTKIK